MRNRRGCERDSWYFYCRGFIGVAPIYLLRFFRQIVNSKILVVRGKLSFPNSGKFELPQFAVERPATKGLFGLLILSTNTAAKSFLARFATYQSCDCTIDRGSSVYDNTETPFLIWCDAWCSESRKLGGKILLLIHAPCTCVASFRGQPTTSLNSNDPISIRYSR